MAYTKTTWLDRVVQFANRYTKSGETSTEVTLVQSPGTVTQAGSAVNAALLNKIEQGIADAHTTADAAVPKAGGTMNGNLSWGTSKKKIFLYESGGTIGGSGADVSGAPYEHALFFPSGAGVPIVGQLNLGYITPDGANFVSLLKIKEDGTIDRAGILLPQIRANVDHLEWNNGGTWQGVGGVKSVQRGTATINNNATAGGVTTVTISAVNLAKAFLNISTFLTTSTNSGVARGELTNTTTITFSNSSTATYPVSWEVIEFY